MSNNLFVGPWSLAAFAEEQYDCHFATIGYESRARHIAQSLAVRAKAKHAIGFQRQQELAYQVNRDFFHRQGFSIEEPSEEEHAAVFRELLGKHAVPGETINICVEISSMTRRRLAQVVEVLSSFPANINVDFVYTVAEYCRPGQQVAPIVDASPVSSAFAGWSGDGPERPNVVIIGLGYEQDRALGVAEYLEASDVWAFSPVGTDPRYEESIVAANADFWEARSPSFKVDYDVTRPFDLMLRLESLVHGIRSTGRPVVFPFGPKIFALASLLVAAMHQPDVGVWRVTSGHLQSPEDRLPSEHTIGLRVYFRPRTPSWRASSVAARYPARVVQPDLAEVCKI